MAGVPLKAIGPIRPVQQHASVGIGQANALRLQALRNRHADVGINPMAMGHQEEPAEGQADLTVHGLNPIHQQMHRNIRCHEQPLLGGLQRPGDETDFALALVGIITNIERPMLKDAMGAGTRSLPVLKEAHLPRHVVEPVGDRLEEWRFARSLRPDFADHTPLHLGPLGLPLVALDATAAIKETADMDDCAAGAVEQAVDRAGEAVRFGQGLAGPAGIEQILFPPRSIARIDDRTSAPLHFSAKCDLDIIGRPGSGWGEHEGAGPAPLGDLQINVFQARPERLDIPAIFGELGRHPLTQLPGSGAVGPNDRPGVAPIIIVDAGQAEIEARKGRGERGTLCVSSQVGCTLNCAFCHTGTQRLVRNLTAGEIVGQVMVARDRLNDWADREDGTRRVTNIVMMGMGEPLYNFDAVRDALLIVADNEGIGISRRRITLSTSGVVPNIVRAGEEIGVMLAISLHAVRDELRNELVPLNRKYPIKDLLQACRDYPGASNARRITFEYVMLKGVNDSLDDAKLLVKLLKGIHAKINLIPFNPWPGTAHECSDWDQIEKFSEYIFNSGYSSPVRTPRGRDILAACGQLKSETEKLSARERQALRAMAMTD